MVPDHSDRARKPSMKVGVGKEISKWTQILLYFRDTSTFIIILGCSCIVNENHQDTRIVVDLSAKSDRPTVD